MLRFVRQSNTSAATAETAIAGRFADITPQAQRVVGRWLLGCAGMCFGAVCIGGITR